ncbi:MAG: response regulator [Deltaproteobacteria bacterium]|nr:response regulator [Deltaproteobacteria bacterium]
MSKRILLVEDSKTMQKIVELTFAAEDFEVSAVSSVDEAIKQVTALSPDVVLADLSLSGRTGYDFCAELKGKGSNVPVLLLHGTSAPYDPAKASSVKADGELAKPFETQALIDRVESLLQGKTQVAPMPQMPAAVPTEAPAAPAPMAAPVPLTPAPSIKAPPAREPAAPIAASPRPVEPAPTFVAPPPVAVTKPPTPIETAVPEPLMTLPDAPAVSHAIDERPSSPGTDEFGVARHDTQPGPGFAPSATRPAAPPAKAPARAPATLDALRETVRTPTADLMQPRATPAPTPAASRPEPVLPSRTGESFITIEAEPPPLTVSEPLPSFELPISIEPASSQRRPAATLLGVTGEGSPHLPPPPPGMPLPGGPSAMTSAVISGSDEETAPVALGRPGGADMQAELQRLRQRVEALEEKLAQLSSPLSGAGQEAVERVAWEVVPQLAEVMIAENLDRLAEKRR